MKTSEIAGNNVLVYPQRMEGYNFQTNCLYMSEQEVRAFAEELIAHADNLKGRRERQERYLGTLNNADATKLSKIVSLRDLVASDTGQVLSLRMAKDIVEALLPKS